MPFHFPLSHIYPQYSRHLATLFPRKLAEHHDINLESSRYTHMSECIAAQGVIQVCPCAVPVTILFPFVPAHRKYYRLLWKRRSQDLSELQPLCAPSLRILRMLRPAICFGYGPAAACVRNNDAAYYALRHALRPVGNYSIATAATCAGLAWCLSHSPGLNQPPRMR